MSSSTPKHRRLDSFNFDNIPQSPSLSTPTSTRSGFPFPQHDSYRRSSRRDSTASIASVATSVGGPLDTASQNTIASAEELAQNSISSLLSPPIVRTGLIPQSALANSAIHRAPTSRDIPPVTLTHVPHIETSAFSSYLSRIGPLFERFQHSRSTVPEPTSPTKERPDYDRRSSALSSPPATPLSPTTPSITRTSSYFAAPPSPDRRRSSARPRRDPHAPTPLSTIPNVYFEENFQLENPRTFDVVSEKSDVIPPAPQQANNTSSTKGAPAAPARKALHTNAILQEKLSWYMDTVEVHLISSIASASQSFFAALGSLKELRSEAEESIAKIQSLRAALQDLDSGMAIGGLEVVNIKRRRENVRKLSAAVDQVCTVVEDARKCDDLVDAGKLEDASTALDELETLMAGTSSRPEGGEHGYPLIDLRQVHSLNVIAEGLTQLRFRIGRGFEARFLDALLTDLRSHVEAVPPRETLQRWASSTYRARTDIDRGKVSNPAYLKTNESLRPTLLAALAGLSASGQASRAATAYREAIMREIKLLIRKNLPSSSDDDADSTTSASTRGGRRLTQQEKSAVLARNLRALDPEAAEELLIKVYTTVGEALRRLGVQVKVLLDVTLSIEAPKTPAGVPVSDPMSPTNQFRDEVTQALDLSSLLGQAVDVVQTQITKVLRVRSEQNSRLPLQEFLRYFALNRMFADECEAVSSRGGEALKDVVNTNVRDFLQFFAEAEKLSVVQTLEADKWEAKDFTPTDEVVLNRILEGMNRTPDAWTSYTKLWEDESTNGSSNGNGVPNGDTESTDRVRTATVDEQRYVLVTSAISALDGIDHFSTVIAAIPSLTVEASLKLLEYLKIFNSRCTQLILGAGATKSAGLKNITSKHLALASQACSLIIHLVPYVREYVRRQAPSAVAAVLPEFDRVKRSFQEHQNSIHEKLVEIMSSRSHAHMSVVSKTQWDELPEDPPVPARIEALAKETGTLHRVLIRHVAEMDIKMIMIPIFNQYQQDWQKVFREAAVSTEKGKMK